MNLLDIQVKDFLTENSLATIGTISKDDQYPYLLPVVYFLDNKHNLRFASHRKSKKIEDILANSHIGVSVTSQSNLKTLQLKGEAHIDQHTDIDASTQLIRIANENIHFSFPPFIKLGGGDYCTVSFTPCWYRFSDYANAEPIFIEKSL
jgi:hypothetical protein